MRNKKKYTVTTYDCFGKVAKKYQADSVAWHNWQCCELDKNIYLNMPAIIVECNQLEGNWAKIINADCSYDYPHEISLLSFNNKVIKKWISNFPPAKRGNWAQFTTSDLLTTQISGCMIIKRIKSELQEVPEVKNA